MFSMDMTVYDEQVESGDFIIYNNIVSVLDVLI